MLVFRFDALEDEHVTPLEGVSGPGDSGGPAIIETADGLRLAGLSVASSGKPKGTYGTWEFYARVSTEVPWIRDMITPSDEGDPTTIPESVPADEAEDIVSPSISPIGDVEPEEASRSGVAIYSIIAIVAGLVLVSFVWWYRRRGRPFESE